MAVATPYILRIPSVTVNTVELQCHLRNLGLTAEDDEADVSTACNPNGTAPGTTTWTCTVQVLQSFGPEGANPGLWDTLAPLAKTKAAFVVKPKDEAVSATNPSATFEAWVPTIPFLDSELGQSTVLDLEFKVVGEPVFATA